MNVKKAKEFIFQRLEELFFRDESLSLEEKRSLLTRIQQATPGDVILVTKRELLWIGTPDYYAMIYTI